MFFYLFQCVPGIGVDAMFRLLFSPPTKIMVLGAACSPVTQATAETSYLWNLVQVCIMPIIIDSIINIGELNFKPPIT